MSGLRIGLSLPVLLLPVIVIFFPGAAWAQSAKIVDAPAPVQQPPAVQLPMRPYKPLTQKQQFHDYMANMFSPYSLASLAFVSGLHQAERNPSEWQEGTAGFSERVASNFGTTVANATTRYLLSEALRENTLYYRCQCRGFWRRLNHAIFYTVIARRGPKGHRVFSVPNFVAPYAGPFASVYGWYPSRFGWEAAFRMGNHGLLSEIGTNISIEFLPTILGRRGRKWASRLHLGNPEAASKKAP